MGDVALRLRLKGQCAVSKIPATSLRGYFLYRALYAKCLHVVLHHTPATRTFSDIRREILILRRSSFKRPFPRGKVALFTLTTFTASSSNG